MRTFLFITSALAVMGLAFWAYQQNYKTQQALSEVRQLQRDIGSARERLSVLRAEWAFLNRPDRLRDLADLNFDRLGLLPMTPDQFGQVDQVTFPEDPPLPITTPVETFASRDLQDQGE
ncbi:cell division protein FtsL [Pseudaestuariivita rosea]|uniref:cell division protein FtsL n=1 Tax=Pseudaestuariivita rosea TaxID=2763263 RepID=UPI001ABA85B6|nr:cell division protein FtsL [Pseudaestuariivita rosea]